MQLNACLVFVPPFFRTYSCHSSVSFQCYCYLQPLLRIALIFPMELIPFPDSIFHFCCFILSCSKQINWVKIVNIVLIPIELRPYGYSIYREAIQGYDIHRYSLEPLLDQLTILYHLVEQVRTGVTKGYMSCLLVCC